jgi:type IV pilus assembly protein PilY1
MNDWEIPMFGHTKTIADSIALLSRVKKSTFALSFCFFLFSGWIHAAPLSIASIPLYLGGTIEPNIIFILDDSGSMASNYMPDGLSTTDNARFRSPAYNKLAYNPSVTYQIPIDENGNQLGTPAFLAAWTDGYDTNRAFSVASLLLNYQGYGYGQWYGVWNPNRSGCNGSTSSTNCYDTVYVSLSEYQNYANWFSYYRTRTMMAKAGVSLAFGNLGTGLRLGYGRINKSTSSSIDGVNTNTLERGVRLFTGTDRAAFFTWLFGAPASGNTPSRRGLNSVGQYYMRTDDRGPWGTNPGVGGGTSLSCRQSYAILTTDGYWNDAAAGTSAAQQNVDGSNGPTITSSAGASYTYTPQAPFSDSYSNGLADVAMYYWNRDLNSNLINNVPPNAGDPAFWQHMVTFGIGLGVEGSIDPTDAFNAISSGATISWPDFNSNTGSARIDDLLHAAVNGRGGFFSATDPQAFASALASTLASISARQSSNASVAVTSPSLSANSRIYQARFDSGTWAGDIWSYAADPMTGAPTGSPTQASTLMPGASARNIFTLDRSLTSPTGIPFLWTNLNTSQKAALSNDSSLLSYLRGDSSGEVRNGGSRRNRSTSLGDIINSSPVLERKADYLYSYASSLTAAERSSYASFRSSSAYLNRPDVLFAGANDGMLHAFNASTLQELFAYVPNGLMLPPNGLTTSLPSLASTSYSHKYFVDGSPNIVDARINGAWKTILVGSTGAGGQVYFALDVTAPGSFGAGNVLWEFTHAELGYAIGQASIVRTQSGNWVAILGNGYNSTSQTARLFIVDLASGTLLKMLDTGVGSSTLPNGLASPVAVDTNGDGSADLVYAGDNQGNLWKFDLSGSTVASWSIAFGGKPLFQATTGGTSPVNQPISSKPLVGSDKDGGNIVYFGTGRYFVTGDNADTTLQTIYGIRDECAILNTGTCGAISGTAKVTRSQLVQQTIATETNSSFGSNSEDIRIVSNNARGTTQRGFFLNLIPPTNVTQGERVVSAGLLWNDRVIFATAIPDTDACSFGGSSWLMELDPYSGGRTAFDVFDLNADGSFNTSDRYLNSSTSAGTVVNGRKLSGGMISTPTTVYPQGDTTQARKVTSNTSGQVGSVANSNRGVFRRQTWRQPQ